MTKSSPNQVSPGPELPLGVARPRKRRPVTAPLAAALVPPAVVEPHKSSLKPLLVGVGVGAALLLAAAALQSKRRQARVQPASHAHSTLLGSLTKVAAVAVARIVAKAAARRIAAAAMRQLANRAVVALVPNE